MQHVESVAAATAIVGYDLLSQADWQQQPYHRVITGMSLSGSAAAADTTVDVFIGPVKIGEMSNTNTGYPTDDDFMGCYEIVPAGAKIMPKVTDAATTNPIYVLMNVAPL